MKRFVDLRGADTGYNFAFWCTVIDAFEEFYGEQAWNTRHELATDFENSHRYSPEELDRHLKLIPDWVPE